MKSVRLDITGQRFGRLIALEYVGCSKSGTSLWRFRCDCGVECVCVGKNVRRGFTSSCGCLRKEMIGAVRRTHGMTRTPTWYSWQAMLIRCRYPSQEAYPRYGGSGITICERWNVFENFLSDMGERPEGMTLERSNPFGNYTPGNCVWATQENQVKNTRGQAAIAILQRLGIDPATAFEEI
jgi:hypothetical protein